MICRTILALLLLLASVASATIVPVDLHCDWSPHPTGIDTTQPILSWKLTSTDPAARGVTQSAYQVLVSSSALLLSENQADLWDTGRITSSEQQIPYAGKALASGQAVYWKVRIWQRDVPQPWSEATDWIDGLLTPGDWAGANWISATAAKLAPNDADGGAELTTRPVGHDVGRRPAAALLRAHVPAASILLRKAVVVHAGLARATMFVTGLGQYELSINGKKVGDQLLSPGWSDYRHTILYDTFDVTPLLALGDNCLGVLLGNGVYNVQYTPGRYVKFTNTFGALKAIAQLRLEYADGSKETIGTDGSWQASPGPITYANFYGGEDFDQRLVPVGWNMPGVTGSWENAIVVHGPGGVLRGHSASAPPIREIEVLHPRTTQPLKADIIDLGQNASVMPRVTISGPAGSFVRIIPAELLQPDGNIDRTSCTQDGVAPAWWQFTLDGSGSRTFFPRFFYQGARYFQVECDPAPGQTELPIVQQIDGVVVHSSAEPIGEFSCSNELFNRIYTLVRWAQRSNMMSLMTDCPHREKLGWLEQLHLNGPSLRYNFDLTTFFHKELNDMTDSQFENGFVPNIAPEYFMATRSLSLNEPFRNSPEWGSSMVIVPWQQYVFTGDKALLAERYGNMVRYVDFLASTTTDNIISTSLGDWYDLGPKPPWGSQLTPPPVTATAIYYYDLSILAKVAKTLGKTSEARNFEARAANVRESFNRHFYDASQKHYASNSQCANAMALALGLAEDVNRPAVLGALVDDIRARHNALSAGDVGYRFVLRALADAGRNDVVFDMNNQTDRPGYGMQISRGATCLTEKWDASVGSFGSQNHFMLGQINEWFFHDLAGIQPDEAAPGFHHFDIKPGPCGDITQVRCRYETVPGTFISEWRINGGKFELYVTVPVNTSAAVYLPAGPGRRVTEGAKELADVPSVQRREDSDSRIVLEVGSGIYRFVVE